MTEEVTSVIVRSKHLRTAKICAPGARTWWRHQGLDWNDFVTNGIPAEKLIETNDPRALRVAEIAREDHG